MGFGRQMVQMFLGDLDRAAIPNSYGAIGPFRCSCRGRAYVRGTTIGVPAIYDDIMENLRVRYVVTYVSQGPLRISLRERCKSGSSINP